MSKAHIRRWVLPVLALLIVGGLWCGAGWMSDASRYTPRVPADNPDLLERALRAAVEEDEREGGGGGGLSADWAEALAEVRRSTSRPATEPFRDIFRGSRLFALAVSR